MSVYYNEIDPLQRDELIRQHVGWLKIYMGNMTEANWRDMRLHAERQLEELCKKEVMPT